MSYYQYCYSYFKKILNFSFKAFIVLATFFVVISLFTNFTQNNKKIGLSDEEILQRQRREIYNIINDPKYNNEKGKNTIKIYRSITCFTLGEACTNNPSDGNKNFHNSLLGFMGNAIVMPYMNPPSSGAYYIAEKIKDAGFVPKTYAAEGIGFNALSGFKNIWLVFRNLVFLVFVLIIIAIGFMIMFRTKINPQASISIESALPKIVISLLLITFSYAIAGFMIDLMYISIGLITVLFDANNSLPKDFTVKDFLESYIFTTNGKYLGWGLLADNADFWETSKSILHILPTMIRYSLDGLLGAILGKWITGFFAAKFGIVAKTDALKNIADKITNSGQLVISLIAAVVVIVIESLLETFFSTSILTAILWAIIWISVIVLYFRIFFMLLRAYINIVLLVIFSPLVLAFEAIPGKSTFSSWIKNLLLNLSTFPVLVVLIFLSKTITQNTNTNMWQAPFLTSIDFSGFQTIVGVVILFMIPDLIKAFKQMSGVKPLSVDLNFMALFAGGTMAAQSAMGVTSQIGSLSMGLNSIKNIFGKKQ